MKRHSMRFHRVTKRILGVLLLVTWLWSALLPSSVAFADEIVQPAPEQAARTVPKDYDWVEMDQELVSALNESRQVTEDFVTSELDRWSKKRINRIDHPFLDWYFNFLHQKATELGVPFAWIAFKLDSKLQVFRNEEEKRRHLNANQMIKKRMEADINRKFAAVVLNQEAMSDLKDIIDRTARIYASAVGVKFAEVKSLYSVPEPDWEKHINKLSQILADTGHGALGMPGSTLAGNLTTQILAITTALTGTKVVTALVAKSGSKLLAKGSATIAAKWGSTLVNPALGVGLVVWDVWSYRQDIAHDRPLLKKDLSKYITGFRNSIQENQEGTGIMDAIASLQMDLTKGLKSQPE